MGRIYLSILLALMILATAVADLGFMHALNDAWPPHARMHAIWNVAHVAATHGFALGLLWLGADAGSIARVRVAVAIFVAFGASFFVASALAPLFGGSVHPDLPPVERPPTLFGMDGNTIGFAIALPLVLAAWWRAERDARETGSIPVRQPSPTE